MTDRDAIELRARGVQLGQIDGVPYASATRNDGRRKAWFSSGVVAWEILAWLARGIK